MGLPGPGLYILGILCDPVPSCSALSPSSSALILVLIAVTAGISPWTSEVAVAALSEPEWPPSLATPGSPSSCSPRPPLPALALPARLQTASGLAFPLAVGSVAVRSGRWSWPLSRAVLRPHSCHSNFSKAAAHLTLSAAPFQNADCETGRAGPCMLGTLQPTVTH